MTTAIQVISRALRLCRVLDAAQAAPADDTQDALAALNNIGQRWLASGLLASWTDATGPTFTLVSPVTANEALAYALALRVAPEYGMELPAPVIAQAAEEVRLLWRDRLVETGGDTTVKALILRSLRILNGAVPTGLPDGVSLPGALRTLNALMDEWAGAEFGFTAPTWASLAATITLPDADHEAVSTQLAMRIASEYGVAIPDDMRAQGMHLLARLFSRYSKPGY